VEIQNNFHHQLRKRLQTGKHVKMLFFSTQAQELKRMKKKIKLQNHGLPEEMLQNKELSLSS